jgi:hypothetical protein
MQQLILNNLDFYFIVSVTIILFKIIKSGKLKFIFIYLLEGKMKYVFFILILFIFFACEKQKTGEVEQMTTIAVETGNGSIAQIPKLNAEYLTSVYEMQELIKMGDQSLELRKNYCEHAYLKDNNVFISMGIGRMHNPKDGKKISQYYVEKAAQNDAIRWASYGEMWLKENYQPPFGKLDSYFNRKFQIINRAIVGDSLFLFIATKIELK